MTKHYHHLRRILAVSLLMLFTGAAYSIPYYVVTNNPWSQSFNDSAMDHIYGPGYWNKVNYMTPAANIFTATTPFVMLEGSDGNAIDLNNFLAANHALIENWVYYGGQLFINAAPNLGFNINCGFDSTVLVYPNYYSTGGAINAADSIFLGPFGPVATSYSGNYLGHAIITGVNLDSLMHGGGPTDLALARKTWGSGVVYFGGLTQPNWWTPMLEGENLWYNIFNSASTPVTPTDSGVLDSFVVFASHNCSPLQLWVKTFNYYPGMGVKTFFGDNSSDSTVIVSAMQGGGEAIINHPYNTSGNYTIKQVLYNGPTVVDSLEFSYAFQVCNTVLVSFYHDLNGSCTLDNGEGFISQPSLTEVDSNNVPIDTISALGGFYYTEYGSLGDIYTFKPISVNGFYVTCPLVPQLTDTLGIGINDPLYFGGTCITGTSFDLSTNPGTTSGTNGANIGMVINNSYCYPQNVTVTLNFSPKYSVISAYPAPTTNVGQTLTWDFNNVSNGNTPYVGVNFDPSGPNLVIGDTVTYTVVVTPIAGDTDASNNTVVIVDTIMGPYDPNHISVSPQGIITAGTKLTYTVEFENVGNAPAQNVAVYDTLSNDLDINSIRMVVASDRMNTTYLNDGVHNIVKFEFPNINLPDSVHFPNDCSGLFVYTINTKSGLPNGTLIHNRAGIYFDNNDVVMTNTVTNIIGSPTKLATINKQRAEIYPNPASDELTIKTSGKDFTSCTISNGMGQVMLQQDIRSTQTKVNVKNLPAGMYFINLVGANGSEVRKFMKM